MAVKFRNPLNNELQIFNPLPVYNHIVSIGQLKETHRVVEEILDNCDDAALNQMFSGADRDLDKLNKIIFQETFRVLYGESGLIKDSTMMYLDKLGEVVEETMRIENLNYFILATMPDFKINWHHLEWGQFAMKCKKLCVLAARDSGKSYFFSNALPIWKMYRYKKPVLAGRNTRPDLSLCHRGVLVTNAEDLGKELMIILKDNIENNLELAKKLLPEGERRKVGWGLENIVCRNGARFGIKSYGSAFRGRHPGYIIVDDFLKENVLYSQLQRQKSNDWFFAVLMNALLKGGSIDVVGTPFSAQDLYGELKLKNDWKAFEYPSVFPNGRLLWPERENWEDLKIKREEMGSLVFSREKLVRPIANDSSIFPYHILERALIGMQDIKLVSNRESYAIKFDRVIVGCDFAISASTGADASVFLVWGVTEREEMYLMYFWRGLGKTFMEQISVLRNINANFHPDIIVAEANQFQVIFVQVADYYGLPIVPHVTTGENKHNLKRGLPSVAVLFERSRIKLPQGDEFSRHVADLFISEFSGIAFTDQGLQSVIGHDDIPMATWQSTVGARSMTTSGVLGYLED